MTTRSNPSHVSVLLFGLVLGAASPALAKDGIDLAHLAGFDENTLDGLMDEHHNLELARIHVAGSEMAKKEAQAAVKEAKQSLNGEKANLKAAKAELDAAKKNENPDRTLRADAKLKESDRVLKAAETFAKWKEQEVKVRAAEIKLAEARLGMRVAELDYARVDLIVSSHSPAASEYSMEKFMSGVQKGTRAEAKAREQVDKEMIKSRQLQDKWRQLSGTAN